MRPRSFDRGNMTILAWHGELGLASMRPRSFDRGNHQRIRESATGDHCFNEAAVFRPRKQPWPLRAGKAVTCFNEAAVFRPRKLSNGMIKAAKMLCFNEAAVFRPRKH